METTSSTLRSKKKGGLTFLLALAVGFPLAWLYTLSLNPEVIFWKKSYAIKQDWATKTKNSGTPLTVFSGGSSTAFQIDSQVLWDEFGIRTVNGGFNAGMGLDGTVALASTFLHKGDTLVLMTEPSILAEGGGDMTGLGSQILLAAHPKVQPFIQTSVDNAGPFGLLVKCRPDLYHSTTMIGKVVSKRPLYRYQVENIRPCGLVTTKERREFQPSNEVAHHHLSREGEKFLKELKAWAQKREIAIIYTLPVFYVPEPFVERQRAANRIFLNEVSKIIPVWPDSYLGASPTITDFSDTTLHMTESAAKQRSRALAIHFMKK